MLTATLHMRSQDSNRGVKDFGLDDEARTMFINVRQQTKKARNNMPQKYNSSSPIDTFNIGDLVSLYIDAKHRKSTNLQSYLAK